MKELFTWCTSLGGKLSGDGLDNPEFQRFYEDYFTDTSVCTTIFITGLIIAAVWAAAFYFGICNFAFRFAKRSFWFIALGLLLVITFFATLPQIVGHDGGDADSSSGIYKTSYITEGLQLEPIDDLDARDEISTNAREFRKQYSTEDSFLMRDKLPIEMSIVNAIYAMIIFFLVSIIIKRFSTHGDAIPF